MNALQRVLIILLVIGIGIRIYVSFFSPFFSGDEISLALNFKDRGFVDLLYPLDTYQSAPPLYLWLVKCVLVLMPGPFWVVVKLVNFVVSLLVLMLVYRLTKQYSWGWWAILWMVLWVFNPFLIYNTLTVKQYGFDLLGVLVLVTYYKEITNGRRGVLFFNLWPLLSNVGLFYTVGFVVIRFFDGLTFKGTHRWVLLWNRIRKVLPYIVGSMVYVGYFAWYMQQSGAAELKSYMDEYWRGVGGFFPLNSGILGFSLQFMLNNAMFFFISIIPIKIALILLVFWGVTRILFNENEDKHMWLLLITGIMIHVILNLMKLFPLMDRLLLYWVPVVYMVLLHGLKDIRIRAIPILVALVLIVGYSFYLPTKRNDVISVFQQLEKDRIKHVYATEQARNDIFRFHDFTDNAFNEGNIEMLDFEKSNSSELRVNDYVISQVNHRYGHKQGIAPETEFMKGIIQKQGLKLKYVFYDFVVYQKVR